MLGFSGVLPSKYDNTPPHLDITAPSTMVEVEIDSTRGVLYVHVEGFTALRICQIKDIQVVYK
jgi:hypothetical protein